MKHRYTEATKKLAFILVFTLLVLCPIFTVSAQTGTVVRAEASTTSPFIGDTLTVEIVISNVQNLYGVNVTLSWNTAVLQETSATSLLGSSGGALHQTASDPLYVVEDNASQALGAYDLVATSVAPAAAFSGNGNIATLQFNVISTGAAGLTLQTQLANYNPAGATFIAHTDTADSVTAVAPGSSTTPTATPTPSSTAVSSSSPRPTSTPEFPAIATLSIVVILASAAVVLSVKRIIKPTSTSSQLSN